ncbi:MAG TPA: TIGR02466 family protein [Polyangiaceae bacterium]|nr:TIGR02466 family protein [Polyangiaceae bacterium]
MVESAGERAVEFTEERLELFPTHVFKRLYTGLEGVNERLARLCLEKEREDQGLVRSNVGSWHSKNDLLKWKDPAIEVFGALVRDLVHAYAAERLQRDPSSFELTMSSEAWANVSRAGHYAKPHVHPSANFAIVYYVDAGDEEVRQPGGRPVSGVLELLDPRNRPEMFHTPGVLPIDTVSLIPRAGLMLAFPAWLYHFVNPYQGTRPRISIACNVTVMRLEERAAK